MVSVCRRVGEVLWQSDDGPRLWRALLQLQREGRKGFGHLHILLEPLKQLLGLRFFSP